MPNFTDIVSDLLKQHAATLVELNAVRSELEELRGKKALLDEHAYPWTPALGVNAWLTVGRQWVLCAGLWLGVVVWLASGTYFHHRHDKLDPETKHRLNLLHKWLPFTLMIVFGYPVFLGFVSHALPAKTWLDFVTDLLLLVAFARLKVLVPYMIGGFAGVCFLFPVLTALQAKLVAYDYGWYSINVIWTTGASNALTAVAEQREWISPWTRWVGQSIGWPCLMSGVPVVMMMLGSDFSDAYKLNFPQLLRYSTFQTSLYLFIYAGVCRSVEHFLKRSGTDEAEEDLGGTPSIIPLAAGILVQFVEPHYGFPITIVGALTVLYQTREPPHLKHS